MRAGGTFLVTVLAITRLACLAGITFGMDRKKA
jgi:hypothetical protein